MGLGGVVYVHIWEDLGGVVYVHIWEGRDPLGGFRRSSICTYMGGLGGVVYVHIWED